MVRTTLAQKRPIANCSIVAAGMMATIIESPDVIQKNIVIPQAQLDICTSQGIPTSGNCAGKSGSQVLDTSACNNTPSDDNLGYVSSSPL
jgi:iron transport multicopper oxidase